MMAAIKSGKVKLVQDENGVIQTSHYLCFGGGKGFRFVDNPDAAGEEVDVNELLKEAELKYKEYEKNMDEADKWVDGILEKAKVGIMPEMKQFKWIM